MSRPERALTRVWWACGGKQAETPEPKGKLDTVNGTTDSIASAPVPVNGPEDGLPEWDQVDWGQAEENVRRLRRRIFAASRAGDLKKVRSLQKLMLRSRSNALVSVRRVTEVNAGRKTAGVDGRIVLGSWEKADMAAWLQHGTSAWRPRPVKRVYVPKSNGRRRGLGIPVIADRALQALAVNALEPEWESRFEPKSYGFRPGRGCHDAIVAIHTTASGKSAKRVWALDADLQSAFDRLSHDHILASLGAFPARGLVRQWLEAGVIEDGVFSPTGEGAPQGGVAVAPSGPRPGRSTPPGRQAGSARRARAGLRSATRSSRPSSAGRWTPGRRSPRSSRGGRPSWPGRTMRACRCGTNMA